MKSLTLKIAGLDLRLELSENKWHEYCQKKYANFLTNNSIRPDFKVSVEFLDSTKIKDIRFEFIGENHTNIFFPSSFRHFQLLNFAIKNSFSGILLRRQGCFIHASAAELNGRGVVFVGISGQGKSSVIRDLGCRILADDRSIIRWHSGQPTVYGSPFYEQHKFAKLNTVFPLAAIFLLNKHRVSKLCVDKLPRREAIFNLIPHIVIREEEGEMGKRIQLELGIRACQLLTKTVPVYKLSRPLNLTGAKLRRRLNEIIA